MRSALLAELASVRLAPPDPLALGAKTLVAARAVLQLEPQQRRFPTVGLVTPFAKLQGEKPEGPSQPIHPWNIARGHRPR